jgi:hypothetical protein
MTVSEPEAISIVGCEAAAAADWTALCLKSAEATPFHTPQWARALRAAFPALREATRLFHFSDGATAVVPMQESGPPGAFCRRVSVEPGVYGGPVGDRHLTDAHLRALTAHYAASAPGGCAIVGNPFSTWSLSPSAGYQRTPLLTHVLCLDDGRDTVWRGLTKGHRCNVKQATRQGVSVAPARGPADVSAYYAVYLDSLRRWGEQARGKPYPETLFHSLLAEGTPFARLWLARVEEEVVSGALVLSWGAVAVYWHGATLERSFALRPSHAVVMAAIEEAIERGCRWFDFNPSGGLEGVIRFKEGFGATAVPCSTWELPPRPAARLAQRVVRRLSRSR